MKRTTFGKVRAFHKAFLTKSLQEIELKLMNYHTPSLLHSITIHLLLKICKQALLIQIRASHKMTVYLD